MAGSQSACACRVRVPPVGPAHAHLARSESSNTAGVSRMRSGRAPGLPAVAARCGGGARAAPPARGADRWVGRGAAAAVGAARAGTGGRAGVKRSQRRQEGGNEGVTS